MTTTTTPAPASDERLPEPIQTGAYFINVNEGTELPMCLLSATPGDYAPFTLYEAVRASELASMRTALAAKDAELAALRTVMVAAAEEIAAHWDAHCDAEGYGPQNLMRRLEEGIPSEYGYTAGAFAELKAKAEARAVPEWPCACDEQGRGEPGVTCGDCPRDYGHCVTPSPVEQPKPAVLSKVAAIAHAGGLVGLSELVRQCGYGPDDTWCSPRRDDREVDEARITERREQ